MSPKLDKPSPRGEKRPADELPRETPTRNLLVKITGKPDRRPAEGKREGETLRVRGGEKYKLGPVVAEGGMGVVRQAEDVACCRIVAIKELHRAGATTGERRSRFIEEARITSQLEHPNIVPIHELGYDVDQNVFYAMKYIRGVTLTEILLRIRKGDRDTVAQYPLPRLLNIFQKVGDAIAFSHSRDIAHCDLKPDNVMICDFGEVVVMDWGLARQIGKAPEYVAAARSTTAKKKGSATRSTTPIFGTPGFISPERMTGASAVHVSWDIYSLGATLYSILTLRPPVKGVNTRETLRRAAAGDILPPAAYSEGGPGDKKGRETHAPAFPHCPEGKIPVALSDIAMKAMATKPEDRYATVQELQAAVEAYQNGLIWHLVVDQDFSGPDSLGRWEVIAGQHDIKNGELRLEYGEPQMLLYKGDVPGDVRIEWECRQEGRYLNSIGCFIGAVRSLTRKEIPLTGYKFEIGAFDNSLNVVERAGHQLLTVPVSAIARGVTYRLRAERVGARLKLTVNGEEVLSVTDPDPLTGADRTAVGVMGWLAQTIITRVRIYTMGTPWKSDVLDIAERQSQKGNYAVAQVLLQEIIDSFPEPERMARAMRALETARRREKLAQDLTGWRQELENTWPGAKFDLRMSNDGLALELGPGRVEDLSPLRGMPITTLICAHNRIRSLEPLRGMPLVSLNCTCNPIQDLAPLSGMKLSVLVFEGCPIESLEPLKGMPLTLINMGGARVRDLGPIRGAPLTFVSCWHNQIESLEPLSASRGITVLYCSANRIATLEPLRDLPIVTMNCSGNRIRSLDPLRGMPLNVLHFGDNQVDSLEPLAKLSLKMLSCNSNRIRSLEPVKDQPLVTLVCGGNQLQSISMFLKKPPEDFRYDCDSLPDGELERAAEAWSKDPQRSAHACGARVLLAARRKDREKLRALATEFNGHRYLLMPKFLSWEEARAFCEEAGGHLLTIPGRDVEEFLAAMFPNGAWFWMGLRTTENGHEWITGQPVTHTNFANLLQERLLGPKIYSGRWASDDVPNAHNAFMIEWDD